MKGYSVKKERKREREIVSSKSVSSWLKLTGNKKDSRHPFPLSLSLWKKEEEEDRRGKESTLFAKRKQVSRKTRASRLITRRIPSNV